MEDFSYWSNRLLSRITFEWIFLKYKIDADFLCTYNLSLYQHFLADATRQ